VMRRSEGVSQGVCVCVCQQQEKDDVAGFTSTQPVSQCRVARKSRASMNLDGGSGRDVWTQRLIALSAQQSGRRLSSIRVQPTLTHTQTDTPDT